MTLQQLEQGFVLLDCRIEPKRQRIVRNGEPVHVEPRVMDVLVALAAHSGQPLSRSELLEQVWSDTVVGDEVLSRAISLLRQALGDDRTVGATRPPTAGSVFEKAGIHVDGWVVVRIANHTVAAHAVALEVPGPARPAQGPEYGVVQLVAMLQVVESVHRDRRCDEGVVGGQNRQDDLIESRLQLGGVARVVQLAAAFLGRDA